MRNKKRQAIYNKAMELIKQGLNQKQTAQKVKEYSKKYGYKPNEYLENIDLDKENLKLLKHRLNEMLNNKTAKSTDIKNLVQSIKQLER